MFLLKWSFWSWGFIPESNLTVLLSKIYKYNYDTLFNHHKVIGRASSCICRRASSCICRMWNTLRILTACPWQLIKSALDFKTSNMAIPPCFKSLLPTYCFISFYCGHLSFIDCVLGETFVLSGHRFLFLQFLAMLYET